MKRTVRYDIRYDPEPVTLSLGVNEPLLCFYLVLQQYGYSGAVAVQSAWSLFAGTSWVCLCPPAGSG